MPRHDEVRDRTMRIGEAASYLGVSVETLRRWDREGSLVAGRSRAGGRSYTQAQLDEHAGRVSKPEVVGAPGEFPGAEQHASRTLSLPLFPGLTTEEQRHVVTSLLEVV